MDLPPLTPQSLNRQLQAPDSNRVLDVGTLQAGTRLLATVESTVAINNALRQKLLDYFQTTPNLHITRTDVENAKAPPQRGFAAIETLFNKAHLFAVQLNVLGKKVLSFSEAELVPKEKVPVIVRRDGQLQLDLPSKDSGTLKMSEPQGRASIALAKTLTDTTLTNRINTSGDTQITQDVLGAGLRHYLPKQKPLSEMVSLIDQLLSAERSLQLSKSASPIASILVKLAPLLKVSPPIERLASPEHLKAEIKNSGSFLESRLATSGRPNLQQSILANNVDPRQTAQNLTLEDTKAIVLRALDQLSLPTPQSPPTADGQSKLSESSLNKLIQSVFSLFPGQPTKNIKSLEQLQSSLTAQLRTMLFSNLARMTSLQIQHLLQSQPDRGGPSFGGILELPVRIGENVYPLLLQLHERFIEEKSENEEYQSTEPNQRKLKKRWQVYFEFDLNELGIFASDITVQNDNVKSTLWIQNPALWSESQKYLDDLKAEMANCGVELEELVCQHGTPPVKTMNINQSLVDVRT